MNKEILYKEINKLSKKYVMENEGSHPLQCLGQVIEVLYSTLLEESILLNRLLYENDLSQEELKNNVKYFLLETIDKDFPQFYEKVQRIADKHLSSNKQ